MKVFKILILVFVVVASGCSAGDTPSDSAKATGNPVAATPDSIASGRSAFARHCADCHGPEGNGVSEIAAAIGEGKDTKPMDLTDGQWVRGSTDAEIFAVIRDGIPEAGMKGLNGRPGVGPQEMWHLVNYVRSIGPK